ncbi:ECF RNA polymerase sigma-E factor [Novipirellula aureliae]|uniref:RNA polymerase sigma factor n=1 Tax=Novipirellula aureliae TaxID=2527966 RepID=A0A5C6E9P5_9BACT|nr:sigma-70 family RNA polymerase sigma factor [Novipirellula aureliae]TWU44186.1 ECF RNA polymerase sigma-E factor [Novipirellula aureliae]
MKCMLNPTAQEQQTVSDRELIDIALSGDESGFGELVQRYECRLIHSMLRNVGCRATAEDIVQETFLKAFRFLRSFRGESGFYTWIHRIALNCRRGKVGMKNNTRSLDSFINTHQSARTSQRESPTAVAERHEDREQVHQALARLSAHHRTILTLREFDGLDYQAIADTLHVGMGTVRSRLSRARNELRRELAKIDCESNLTAKSRKPR